MATAIGDRPGQDPGANRFASADRNPAVSR
jgi:hypothetical protein